MRSYSKELGDTICELIAEGKSIRVASKMLGISHNSVTEWSIQNSEFSAQYMRARESRADLRAEAIDDYKTAMIALKMPTEVARIAIDAEKWQASKENPKRYSDKTIISGDAENPLQMLAIRLDQAIARKQNNIIDVTPSNPQITSSAAAPPEDNSDLW